MADKSFGVKELNLLNASGTPTVTSPNNLNLNANTVAISTSCTIGNNLTVTSTTNSANLNVTGIGTLTRAFATDLSVSGVTTITVPANANPHSSWDVVNNSSSAYRFTGPGQDGAEDNPNIYLVRGQRYVFKMNASGHPFQIRVANGGAAYSDGVTNNGSQTGNVVFNVQHDAPAQLFYQCTSHGSMVGNIYIVGGPQVISGVVTATSFSGSGANLTSLPAQATIANNADNRVITGGSGVNLNGEANLTFNGNTLSVTGTTNLYGNGGASAVWGNTGYTGHLTYDGSDNAVIRAASGKALIFQTNHTNERLRITSSGTAVFGGNAAAPIVDNGELYYRGNSTSTFQNLPQNFYLYSDDKAYNATNPGAGMLFGGQYTSGGQYTTFAGIHGIKEDNTDNNYNSALVFGTRQQGSNTWERLRIASDGKLLVGRTSSITITGDGSSHVFEAITDNGYALATHSNTSNKRGIGIYYPTGGTAGDAIRFAIGSSAKFIVLGSGNVQNANNTYTNISDATLKENIVDANSQWNDIKNIKIRNYNFKASTGYETHTQIGVIAQELELVAPKLVDSSGKDGIKSVASSVLYMKAVKALQEAMAKIEILEAKVAALEGS